MGDPQVSSANGKSAILRIYKKCYISEHFASVAILDFRAQFFTILVLRTFYNLLLFSICGPSVSDPDLEVESRF
jgi:hypothetical protein